MTIVKNNPRHINFLFDEIFNGFPAHWAKDSAGGNFAPATNIHETTDGYHIELNAPGRKKEDFKINVEANLLTISFEKKEETPNAEYKTLRREFNLNSFKRSFSLDEKIDAENIKAKYENGVLQIFLAKKEVVKIAAKAIEIL